MVPEEQILAAIQAMRSVIPFFPEGSTATAVIADELFRMVESAEALEWLRRRAINTLTRWRGFAELRALYCSHWKPKDGIQAAVQISGYTAEELENRSRDREAEEDERRLLLYRMESKKLPPVEPLQIRARQMPYVQPGMAHPTETTIKPGPSQIDIAPVSRRSEEETLQEVLKLQSALEARRKRPGFDQNPKRRAPGDAQHQEAPPEDTEGHPGSSDAPGGAQS